MIITGGHFGHYYYYYVQFFIFYLFFIYSGFHVDFSVWLH